MEKTIVIDGQEVRFKSTAATPLRYKAQFGKDFFMEIIKLKSLGDLKGKETITVEDLQKLDFEMFYEIAWTMAKTAESTIPEPLAWLDTFESFPMIEVIPQLQDMILSTLQAKKK